MNRLCLAERQVINDKYVVLIAGRISYRAFERGKNRNAFGRLRVHINRTHDEDLARVCCSSTAIHQRGYLELLHIVEQEFGLPWLKKQVKNEQGIYHLRRFPAFTLNRLKHAQLDHTVVAQVRSY
jgi:hypothetical protein